MVKQYICLVLLVVFISIAESKKCYLKTESVEITKVCCADYEANGNDCVACSKGYTSAIGQQCKPCSKNTFGERCRYECFCLGSEICDNVEGCVEYATTTDTSVHARSSTFMQRSTGKRCETNTESGEIIKVCCTDYEEKGNECILCSRGYTSETGQNCTTCPKNTYGDRCKYECSCSGFETCDNVKGCVGFPFTTGTSVNTTPSCSKGYTSYMGQRCKPCSRNTFGERCRDECTCSGFEICDHVEGCVDLSSTTGTSVPATTFVDDRTYISIISEKTDTKNELMSREINAYYIVPLLVVVPGIILCFFFYKFKIVDKMKKAAMTHCANPSLHVLQNTQEIEMEESLYDTIDDTDMLGYVRRMLKSTDYIDV